MYKKCVPIGKMWKDLRSSSSVELQYHQVWRTPCSATTCHSTYGRLLLSPPLPLSLFLVSSSSSPSLLLFFLFHYRPSSSSPPPVCVCVRVCFNACVCGTSAYVCLYSNKVCRAIYAEKTIIIIISFSFIQSLPPPHAHSHHNPMFLYRPNSADRCPKTHRENRERERERGRVREIERKRKRERERERER